MLRFFQSFFLLIFFVNGCAYPKNFPQPENPKNISLKVINYNTWHGLGSGFLKRAEIDPPAHRKKRYQEQIQLLKSAQADILFLQELNPVTLQSKKIAQQLGMEYVFQETNCGLSILNLGIPVNLSMGIGIFVKAPLQIKKIAGLKLSGPPGFCNPYFTFQYAEFRYALFALAYHPEYGSFLLVNTHFHHGVEWSPKVRDKLKDWEEMGLLSKDQKSKIEKSIEDSNLRREKELKTVFSTITDIQTHYKGLPVILAGDLNSTVESPIYRKIVENHNLIDSGIKNSSTPYTWDPPNNKKNHLYTADLGLTVPTFNKPEVEVFFKEYDRRQRRIDYIFVSSEIQILSHELFANQPTAEGFIASDHFGIQVSMETKDKNKEQP